MRLLLVEDDESIIGILSKLFAQQSYVFDVARDGEAGWELVQSFGYDLLILDLMLPKLDGISFCRRLREQKNQVPVMLLTARDTTTDKLMGLDSGADDYVVKPFNIQELTARIRALLRRSSTLTMSVLTCGELQLDCTSHLIRYRDRLLEFSRTEYLLLELFLRNQQRIYSCSELVDQLWSLHAEPPNESTIRSHIKNIRRELKRVGADDLIETIYGQGYRINPIFLQSLPTHEDTPMLPEVAQQEALDLGIREIWLQTREMNLERVAVLDQVLQGLESGDCDPALIESATQSAHKLAGSLGMFGFDSGTTLSRRLETLLQSSLKSRLKSSPGSQKQLLKKLQPLLDSLHQELAVMDEQLCQPQTAGKPLPVLSSHSARILAVDDDPQILLALQALLKGLGFELTTLSEIDQFWEVLEQSHPDLLILDIQLNRANGLDLCQSIRQHARWNWLPVLFLTSFADQQTLKQAFVNGADDYVTKPIVPQELTTRIINRLQRIQVLKQWIGANLQSS